jgi:radical SAM protein with 4Fe4S-binding SPASM domain
MAQKSLVFPTILDIELTNACNLRCEMCPRTTSMTRPVGYMNFDLFKKIVDEAGANGVESITLHVFGESMLHPKLFDCIRYIKTKDKRIKTYLSTNCTLLGEKRNAQLLASGLDFLILSMDGATKATYEKIRAGAKFENAVQGIKHLLELKKEKGLESPLVSIQIIYMQETDKEIKDFFKMWKPYLGKRDYIAVKEYSDFSGQVKGAAFPEELPDFNNMPCGKFVSSAVIYWDGTVTVCCLDVNGALKIGKVNGQTLKQVWNGEKLKKMRKSIVDQDYREVEFCRKCKRGPRLLYQYPPPKKS